MARPEGSRCRRAIISIALIVMPFTASALSAQSIARITTSAGAPIENASVDLWSDGVLQMSARTDYDGVVRFVPAVTPSTTAPHHYTIRARRVGFAPRMVRTERLTDTLHVELEAIAFALPAMVAQVQVACPQAEDPDARALWETARSRYGASTQGLSLWWAGTESVATVSAAEIGSSDNASAADGNFFRVGDFTRRTLGISLPPAYAARIDAMHQPAFTANGRYGAWRYPELEANDASHFADPEFGRLHTFRIGRSEAQATTLIFCSTTRDADEHALLDGTITMGADGDLIGATWGFTTAAPHENAGGTVTFGRATLAGAARLVALEGAFWRQLMGRDRYLERAVVIQEWRVRNSPGANGVP